MTSLAMETTELLVPDGAMMCVVLICLWIWHYLAFQIELICDKRIPVCLHAHSVSYVIFLVLTAAAFCDAMMALDTTAFLKPEKVKERFKDVGEPWQEEVDLTETQWLRWLSLLTPLPVAMTYLICCYNTIEHLGQVRRSGRKLSERVNHDRSMTIIALPVVYGLMSFQSVCSCWKACTNTFSISVEDVTRTWADRKELVAFEYETNFMVADLYEAWALWRFAQLTLFVIQSRLKTEGRVMSHQSAAVCMLDGQVTEAEKSLMTTLKQVASDLSTLSRSLTQLVMQGTYAFVATCLLEAAYYAVVLMAVKLGLMKEEEAVSGRSSELVEYCFLGMGLVSSTAAISNIVVVEMAFHEFLIAFGPFWKFWGTKILVSIAFMQNLLLYLPIFGRLSETKKHLLFSSLLCYECFLVAVIGVFAWRCGEAWYDLDLADLAPGVNSTPGEDGGVELVTLTKEAIEYDEEETW